MHTQGTVKKAVKITVATTVIAGILIRLVASHGIYSVQLLKISMK